MGKQSLIFIICICVLIMCFGIRQTVFARELTNISQIANTMLRENITVQSWAIYGKQVIQQGTEEILESTIDQIMEQFPTSQIVVKRNGLEKQITLALPSNYESSVMFTLTDNKELYVIYKASDTKWDKESWLETKDDIQSQIDVLFDENPLIFSCVNGVMNDTLKDGLTKEAEGLMESFQGKEVESIDEGTFVSVSAYTTQWNDYLPTENKKMNLQIALRDDIPKKQTRVTIGTPIITMEY